MQKGPLLTYGCPGSGDDDDFSHFMSFGWTGVMVCQRLATEWLGNGDALWVIPGFGDVCKWFFMAWRFEQQASGTRQARQPTTRPKPAHHQADADEMSSKEKSHVLGTFRPKQITKPFIIKARPHDPFYLTFLSRIAAVETLKRFHWRTSRF